MSFTDVAAGLWWKQLACHLGAAQRDIEAVAQLLKNIRDAGSQASQSAMSTLLQDSIKQMFQAVRGTAAEDVFLREALHCAMHTADDDGGASPTPSEDPLLTTNQPEDARAFIYAVVARKLPEVRSLSLQYLVAHVARRDRQR